MDTSWRTKRCHTRQKGKHQKFNTWSFLHVHLHWFQLIHLSSKKHQVIRAQYLTKTKATLARVMFTYLRGSCWPFDTPISRWNASCQSHVKIWSWSYKLFYFILVLFFFLLFTFIITILETVQNSSQRNLWKHYLIILPSNGTFSDIYCTINMLTWLAKLDHQIIEKSYQTSK